MRKPTIASLTLDVVRLSNDISEMRYLRQEVKFLSKVNLYTSTAIVFILIALGYVCFSIM
mgnify:CR=1 FL=1